jgi:hypothetical protein
MGGVVPKEGQGDAVRKRGDGARAPVGLAGSGYVGFGGGVQFSNGFVGAQVVR